MSMTINVENLEKFIATRTADAAAAYAKAHNLQKGMQDSGVDPTTDNDAFDKVNTAWKEHSVIRDEIEQAKDKLIDIKGWGGGATATTGEPQRPIAQADAKRSASFGEKATQRIIGDPRYETARKAFDPGLKMTDLSFAAIERGEFKSLITGLSDTSGGAFVLADRQNEIVDLLRRPRIVASLITVGTTDSDLIEYVEQTTRTNGAAETLEATTQTDSSANAPESTTAFAIRQKIVQEIKHYMAATKRAISDAGQLQTILDAEMIDGLLERLDTQILSGDGNTPNLPGIYNTSGISTFARGGDKGPDALHKALTLIRLAYLEPDNIGLHPNDAQDVRLEKDSTGNYLFGPPSVAGGDQCWGVRMVNNPAFTDGTPLVGAYRRCGRLWIRSDVSLTMTDSHDDWFTRGLVALLASMRACFAVIRPAGFCTITSF